MKAERRNEAHTSSYYSYFSVFYFFLSIIYILRRHHPLYIHRKELMGKISNWFNLICQKKTFPPL